MAFPSRCAALSAGMMVAAGLGWLSFSGSPAVSAQAPDAASAAPKAPVAAAAAPSTAPPSGEYTQGAMQVADLLASLNKLDSDGNPIPQKMGFEIPEQAINEYLAYSLRNKPRPGIASVTVSLLPKNELTATVEIDFNSVTQWNPEILPEPLRTLLSGRRTMKVNAHFESGNGTFTFTLKDAHGPDGKPLDNQLMMTLLQAIGEHQPESYNAGKPISLPFGLKRVWTGKQSVMGET